MKLVVGGFLMSIFFILLFVLAISIDGVAVGIAYGMKGLKVPVLSLVIIGVASGVTVSLALILGNSLQTLMSPFLSRILGGSILALLGFTLLYERNRVTDVSNRIDITRTGEVAHFKIPFVNLVVKILREPSEADIDHSGVIGSFESFILGLALSLDAFGAGIAAGFISLPVVITGIITAATSSILLAVGSRLGQMLRRAERYSLRRVPGFLLIGLGILRLFK